MSWIGFAYTFAKNKSSARVTIWRRLQRLGTISPTGNLYILPHRPECVEAFQWLTQEVQQAEGQALMSYWNQFEGMSDQALVDLFCEARGAEYTAVLSEITQVEQSLRADNNPEQENYQTQLAKLRKQISDIARIDYFDCPEKKVAELRISQLETHLGGDLMPYKLPQLNIKDFQNKVWVTRPQPHVDRLASIWLIRRFIDANPTIRYRKIPKKNEISFDMKNAQFGHHGNLCTFETLIQTFQINEDGLQKLSEIVHEIDLYDGCYNHPETVGIDALLKGWLNQNLSDKKLEKRGLNLFDGLLKAIA
ncbi:MAG: chromate resistance protein ChrB domain-containing protein [Chloroflexota bacterium]